MTKQKKIVLRVDGHLRTRIVYRMHIDPDVQEVEKNQIKARHWAILTAPVDRAARQAH